METRIAPKYRLEVAIRPFSYSVALGACALGGMWALRWEHGSPWLLVIIIFAGVLLQMGVNLVNNRADLDVENLELSALEREAIARQFKIGLACFAGALAIALLLVAMRGWPLAVLLIVGFLGAWFYTAEPIHYKRRGLGVPLVFLFMGVLMICGAAIAMGAPVNFHLVELVLLSLPISLLTALLLLANELRDYERDIRDRLGTLSVRIGLHRATRLFMAMLAAAYLLTVLW
ncbi:MAG: prenyltransferase, partial [Phycisphaeraceae bacterium]|nr:prenyltransferase [Phycisphaeraceae bacterium]